MEKSENCPEKLSNYRKHLSTNYMDVMRFADLNFCKNYLQDALK